MLDLNYVRENLPRIEEMLGHRGLDPAQVLGDFRNIDERRRNLITRAETLKAQRNRASEEIARLKKSGQDATAQVEQNKALREQGEALEKQANDAEQQLRNLLAGIPNVPHSSVPIGKSPEDNVEIRRWGTPPKFDFAPKPHWELGEQLGVLDLAEQPLVDPGQEPHVAVDVRLGRLAVQVSRVRLDPVEQRGGDLRIGLEVGFLQVLGEDVLGVDEEVRPHVRGCRARQLAQVLGQLP